MEDAQQQWPGRAFRVSAWGRFAFAILIGLLFWLPHAVRMITLHSMQQYTPFSVITPNNTVWDESFLYAAQANTMLQQHRRADDTDSWEHRDSYFPYSILPAAVEVAFAKILAPGDPREGLKRAQILFHFLFPAIMAWQIMSLLDPSRRRIAMPAALALLVMVFAFSARTLLSGVLSWPSGYFLGTLQASRSPNPNVSFVIYLAAVLLLLRALRKPSSWLFVAAGFVGSLLFYSYSYYAISWCAACALLALLSVWPAARISRQILWAFAASCVGAVPYLLWTHASKVTGSYGQRAARLGLVYSHAVSPQAVQLTVLWGAGIAALVLAWLCMRRGAAPDEAGDAMQRAVLVTAAVAASGLAGMNMQLLTGFNAQAEFHFTHMVVQPAAVLLVALLLSWSQRAKARLWLWRAAFALLFLACTASQVSAGMHSAPFHRINSSDEALFNWLASHSKTGAVIATTNLRVDLELPIYTQDRVLVVNGTRAAGSDDAAVERLLLANRLANSTSDQMLAELRGDTANPDGVQIETYGGYLFERSPLLNPFTHNFAGAQLPALMRKYRQMDPAQELRQFRVDYIYARNGQTPAAIKGWSANPVLRTPEGTLWQLHAALAGD